MIQLLEKRNVSIQDIVDCVVYLESGYKEDAIIDENKIKQYVLEIIQKREVIHAIKTGVALDMLAEQDLIEDQELNQIIKTDESLYGVDEVLAYGICNLYGSIALTNFGYIDRVKPGIIGKLNENKNGMCHTFLDDIIGAIAASAASKMAHNKEK